MRYIIALYEIDRAYGGAEEGGWWYDTGELARLLALAPTEARAIQLADRANRLLERLQRHRRRVDRLGYVGVHAGFQAIADFFAVGVSRRGDDGNSTSVLAV